MSESYIHVWNRNLKSGGHVDMSTCFYLFLMKYLSLLWRVVAGSLCLTVSISCTSKSHITGPLPHVTGIHSQEFRQQIGALLGANWTHGNKVVALNNGDEIFPEMLAAIRSAKRTINFETFVFSNGDIPEQFVQAFEERARAGVTVNLIFDAFGCMPAGVYIKRLETAGVNVELYHSMLRVHPMKYVFRTHRKYLIVDGRLGFIGGVGIDDRWKGKARNENEWREMHFRVEGPVVAQLQAGFAENWLKTREEVLQGADYFPPLSPKGTVTAAGLQSAPAHGRFDMELMYHLVIASAKRSLLIANPYFLPDRAIQDALCNAVMRGVRVVVLLPGEHTDAPSVARSSKKCWPRLAECGVNIYQYNPTMLHTKLMIADGFFVSVGSGNFDPRSLRINDEANLNILDSAFARQMVRTFAEDLNRSTLVDCDQSITDLSEIILQIMQTPLEGQM